MFLSPWSCDMYALHLDFAETTVITDIFMLAMRFDTFCMLSLACSTRPQTRKMNSNREYKTEASIIRQRFLVMAPAGVNVIVFETRSSVVQRRLTSTIYSV